MLENTGEPALTVQMGGEFQEYWLETPSPYIDLIRARIVQQNTDRGRQDHFHFFGRESGLF